MTTETEIYVACLAAYNAGFLHGAWIDANQTEEEIMDEIRAMLADSPIPGAEEWEIHDDSGNLGSLYRANIAEVSERAALVAEYGEAAIAYLKNGSNAVNFRDFEDQYIGAYDSMIDYAMECVEDLDLPEIASRYFDYKKFAHDLEIELTALEEGNMVYLFR